ncbi:HYC_CC_PP family protein [Wenyingzhuangia sp. 2_MG-2023]|uniref:HYC_CC_PP family protein n=1 Tax=Wenyingzhuangia sp. 2_MG-2023 TaxID=3062639 RepID=UPI0026E48454|nr:hypothetical protein [Wenyingzhuangia sp. 2_MG-2023]MDO6739252.1 hypothetical protein [Wenyingzhuangia sp. 2_MG-2023]
MKSIFHKITSLLMAFVVLFSTMSFTVDMHFCGDMLMDTSVFHKAKSCGMEMTKETSKNEICVFSEKGCCNDQQILVDGNSELQQSLHELQLNKQLFIASFAYTYMQLFVGVTKEKVLYQEYKIPLVTKRIYKLDESYLI